MAVVGRIARAHGIRGQVIVNPETDFPRRAISGRVRQLFVNRPSGAVETLTITTVRFQHERPVIGFAGVDDMNAANALAGLELRVPVERLAPLPPGTFYRHDLIGCVGRDAGRRACRCRRRRSRATLGGSRLVVDAASGGEMLVPLVAEICRVDRPGRRSGSSIAPPDGLLDLNRTAEA